MSPSAQPLWPRKYPSNSDGGFECWRILHAWPAGSLRARSTRSIGDPLGLDRSIDRLDRSGIPFLTTPTPSHTLPNPSKPIQNHLKPFKTIKNQRKTMNNLMMMMMMKNQWKLRFLWVLEGFQAPLESSRPPGSIGDVKFNFRKHQTSQFPPQSITFLHHSGR